MKLSQMAEKYSDKIANGFDANDIKMLERICNAMKKSVNKLSALVAAESAIESGKKRVTVCIVERTNMALVLVKSYFVFSTFEAKALLTAEYGSMLVDNADLLVMKYN